MADKQTKSPWGGRHGHYTMLTRALGGIKAKQKDKMRSLMQPA